MEATKLSRRREEQTCLVGVGNVRVSVVYSEVLSLVSVGGLVISR